MINYEPIAQEIEKIVSAYQLQRDRIEFQKTSRALAGRPFGKKIYLEKLQKNFDWYVERVKSAWRKFDARTT